jgi:hypothetical protein
MTDEWLTYAEAAERLHTTPQGARQRAIRGRWQKTIGNDKKPRIRLPDGWADTVRTVTEHAERKSANTVRTLTEHVIEPALANSLREHIETLKAQLAEETAALREHNATLKAELEHRGAEIDTLKAQLAASEERTAATGFAHARPKRRCRDGDRSGKDKSRPRIISIAQAIPQV